MKSLFWKAFRYYLISSLWIFGYYFLRVVLGWQFLEDPRVLSAVFIVALLILIPFFLQLFQLLKAYFEKML